MVERRRKLEELTAAEIEPLENLFHPKYPEKLRDVARTLFVGLLDLQQGQTPLQAAHLALELTEGLSQELGGDQFYMHKGTRYRLTARDREIVAEYKGWNINELAKRHNLSDMRIRQIWAAHVAEQRQEKLERAAREPELPMPPAGEFRLTSG